MRKRELFQAFSVAGYNFRQWHKNPRVFVAFALAFILCFMLSNKVVLFAESFGTSMQFLEPFIWTFGDSGSILLSSLLLVLLFADMPFLSTGTPFYLMRTTRKVWLTGQAVYTAAATLIYLMFVMLSTSLVCARNSFAANMWSETAAMLGYSSAGGKIAVPAAVKAMEMASPFKCAAIVFLLMLVYTLLMVSVMLLLNLWKGPMAGMTGVLGFSLYGFLLNPDTFMTILDLQDEEKYKATMIVGWLSPLNQATFSRHNFGYDLLPTLGQSYCIYAVLIGLCFTLSLRAIENYSFSFTGTQGGN